MRALPWLIVVLLVISGCGSDESDDDTATEPSPSASATEEPAPAETRTSSPSPKESEAPPTGTVVITADSEYGEMLFDRSGQPIYLFDREASTDPACYDECAENWPPVLTEGDPQPQGGVRGGLLGTTKRSDGSTQVTYGGHPLYYYAHEGKYEVLCHDVEEYGGVWLVVTPAGEAAPA